MATFEFEYDPNKSKSNKDKHGISFEEAKILWNDENALVALAHVVDSETRYAIISKILGKCYVAIFSIRENKYRIISVRRCRKNEEDGYESFNSGTI